MRNVYAIYSLSFLIILSLSCSKDILKPYSDRIIGTWKITDIDRFGIGGSGNIVFPEETVFTFTANSGVTCLYQGQTYSGSWSIRKERREDDYVNTLHITAVDFTNQNVRSDSFSEMSFTGTDRFKAFIYLGTKTFVYHFERQ